MTLSSRLEPDAQRATPDTDFYAWTYQQATALKEGRWSELDVAHIAEELETLGRSEKRELQNRLVVLLTHLLKWQYQPIRRSHSWRYTIKEQRIKVVQNLNENPSLKSQLGDILQDAYRVARIRACKQTWQPEETFPLDCSYSQAQVLDLDFYPD